MASPIAGVCPVLATPFGPDGEVDLESFASVVDHVLATGVTAVMFPGYASEFYKLSDRERDRLEDLLLERTRVPGTATAVISVADHATTVATARLSAARDKGAGAFNLLPPHRMAISAEAAERHFDALLAAAAPLPCVIHHAPELAPAGLGVDAIARLAGRHPNLRLVKADSAHCGPLLDALARLEPPIQALVGNAGVHMVDAWRRGAVGVQPGCSVTEIYIEVWRRLVSGDLEGAQALHGRLLPHISYWMQSVELVVAAEKEILRRRGLIASAHSRAPGCELDAAELRMLDEFMHEFAGMLRRPVTSLAVDS